jgi:hypothetical protein
MRGSMQYRTAVWFWEPQAVRGMGDNLQKASTTQVDCVSIARWDHDQAHRQHEMKNCRQIQQIWAPRGREILGVDDCVHERYFQCCSVYAWRSFYQPLRYVAEDSNRV